MAENALTKVARIAAGSAMGATYKDKDGKQQVIKPTGDANYLDLSGVITNSGSSSDGGGTNPENPDHPAAGADYYAGSLADGEITQRKLEWSGTDDPTQSNKITFADDPGTKLFGQFDGITVLGHIQKTLMTKGVLGAVTNVPINYDPKNAVKTGYFTTNAPYPLYIKTASLPVGQKLPIQITGIGENLSGKNVKAPILSLTFNADKTMTIEHASGYDNDGNTAGATGANYDIVVDSIATFSTQPAVAQLPESIKYFSGSVHTNKETPIVLSGVSDWYENSSDGLLINFNDYAYSGYDEGDYRISLTDLGIKSEMVIPKEKLIIGNTFKLLSDSEVATGKINTQRNIPVEGWRNDDAAMVEAPSLNLISIHKGNITLEYAFNMSFMSNVYNAFLDIQSITPYRK